MKKTALILFFLTVGLANLHCIEGSRFLNEEELSDFTIRAFQADKKALARILQDYKSYELKRKKGASLSPQEVKLYQDIAESLQLLAPRKLKNWRTSKKEIPRAIKDFLFPEAPFYPAKDYINQILKDSPTPYFNFLEGSSYDYQGRRRDIINNLWTADPRRLNLTVLNIEKTAVATITTFFKTIALPRSEWTEEQSLLKLKINKNGVALEQEVLFNQPEAGILAPIGLQESYWIAKFPLRQKLTINRFHVETLTATLRVPLGEFKNCLLINGPHEQFHFAAKGELLLWRTFDEEWALQTKSDGHPLSWGEIEEKDRQAISKQVRKYCRRLGLKVREIYGFKIILNSANDRQEYVTRTLAYQPDRMDPDQKRYQLLEQRWIKIYSGGKTRWEDKSQSPF